MASKTMATLAALQVALDTAEQEHAKIYGTQLDAHIAAQLVATNVLTPVFNSYNAVWAALEENKAKARKGDEMSARAFTAKLEEDAKAEGTEWHIPYHKVQRALKFRPHGRVTRAAFQLAVRSGAFHKRDADPLAALKWDEYLRFLTQFDAKWWGEDGTLTAKGKRERGKRPVNARALERKFRDLGTGDHITAIVEDEEFEGDAIAIAAYLEAFLHDVTAQVTSWIAENTEASNAEDIKAALKVHFDNAKPVS
jgi:hypothetical protein